MFKAPPLLACEMTLFAHCSLAYVAAHFSILDFVCGTARSLRPGLFVRGLSSTIDIALVSLPSPGTQAAYGVGYISARFNHEVRND